MSETFQRVLLLLKSGKVRISDHAYDELYKDGMIAEDVLAAMPAATVVEDYPDANRAPQFWFYSGLQMGGRFTLFGVFISPTRICPY